MVNEYSVDEMLSFYDETMRELTKTVAAKSKAKRLAKNELHKKYPMNVIFSNDHTSERGRLIGGMAIICHRYYTDAGAKKAVTPDQYRFEAVEVETEKGAPGKDRSFRSIILELAATGFIPKLEVIKVFMNGKTPKADSYTSQVSSIKKHNYIAKKNAFGYEVILVAPKETEEEKRQRIFNEKLAEIQKRHEADIEELKKQFLTK